MENYKQYIEVAKKIEALEAEKEVLREKISAELPETGYKDETITAFWKISKNGTPATGRVAGEKSSAPQRHQFFRMLQAPVQADGQFLQADFAALPEFAVETDENQSPSDALS